MFTSYPSRERHSRTRKKENHLHPSTTSELLFYRKSTTILQASAQAARSLHRTGPRPAIVITPTPDPHGTLLSAWRFPVTPSQPEPGVSNSEVRKRSATRQSRRGHHEARIVVGGLLRYRLVEPRLELAHARGECSRLHPRLFRPRLPARSKRRTTASSTSI